MIARGLLALLSPHEELTLRRVASGTFDVDALAQRDVDRLQRLGLIEIDASSLHLTPLGHERLSNLMH
jgi:hypothetical protein